MDERIYVIGIDMDNKEPKDIAQEAMEKIAGLFDKLIEEQNKSNIMVQKEK